MAEPILTGEPLDAALAYWRALEAPASHVAERLGISLSQAQAGLAAAPAIRLPGVPSPTPWPKRTVTALVARGLLREPGQTLLFAAGEGALTVGDVRALVSQLCSALVAAGAGPNAPVAVDATQRLEACLVVYAAMLIGAPVVRLAGFVDAAGLRARLQAAPAVVTISAHAAWAQGLPEAGLLLGLDAADGLGFADWLDGFAPSDVLPEAATLPSDTALLGFTSGSTGTPKCVRTSHEAVFRSTEAMQAVFGFGADDLFCTATDFSALSAFRSLVTLPLMTGGRALLPGAEARAVPLALAAECRDFGVTRLTAVPAVLRGLIAARDRLGPAPLPALKMALSGSGILDQPTRDRFEAAYGVPVIDYYGGREFATAVYADVAGRETVSSAGGLPVNCLVRIVDDDGGTLPDGQIGQIMVHSDCLMQDLPPPEHQRWLGWHASGDLGRIDSGGRLQVVGRRREVIKARDGTLLFPIEIEAVLMTLAGVRDVAVFGHAAEDGVEHVIAAAVLEQAEPDFAQRARAHVLAAAGHMRVPSRVFALDALPRVASEKVDRARLRAQLAPQLQDL